MEEQVSEMFDISLKFERYSFLKGVAGLYFNSAIVLNLGLFGLLILEVLSGDKIFYDKGIARFTLVQVGEVVVFLGLFFNLIYNVMTFLTDHKHAFFLDTPEQQRKLKLISFQPLLLGIILALALIILGILGILKEYFAWVLGLTFLGIYLISIWRMTGHWPTLIVGVMILTMSIMTVFSPTPIWTTVVMLLTSAAYIGAIASHSYAQES